MSTRICAFAQFIFLDVSAERRKAASVSDRQPLFAARAPVYANPGFSRLEATPDLQWFWFRAFWKKRPRRAQAWLSSRQKQKERQAASRGSGGFVLQGASGNQKTI